MTRKPLIDSGRRKIFAGNGKQGNSIGTWRVALKVSWHFSTPKSKKFEDNILIPITIS